MKKINAKIGHVNNADLPPLKSMPGGHYVYVKAKGGNVSVHTVTSIERKRKDRSHQIPLKTGKKGETRYVSSRKLRQIRDGTIYPIPVKDANFKLWSAFRKKPIKNVPVSKINFSTKKKVKRKHFFIFK